MYTTINDELDTVWDMYQLALEELIEKHDEESNIPEAKQNILDDFKSAMHNIECWLKDKTGEELIFELFNVRTAENNIASK